MLKAVIFDDEYIVIQGLKSLIHWAQYGIEVVGTASDGISAFELFQTLKPDIVFTDIRMPGMDGLELIQKIMKEAPTTICIVFSGFNEFEYVKKALKLGVADYLDKPVTIPMIEEAVERTLKRIEDQNEMTNLKLERKKTKQELMEKATLDLLLNKDDAYKKWHEHFRTEADRVVAATVISYYGKEKMPIIRNDSVTMVSVWNGKRDLVVIFYFNQDFSLTEQYITEWINRTNGIVGSGQIYNDLELLSKSYREALNALEYGCFLEEEGWIRFENLPKDTVIPEELSNQVKDILSSMRKRDETGTENALTQYIDWIEFEKLDRDMAERELLKLIYLVIEVVKETAGESNVKQLATYQLTGRFVTPKQEMKWHYGSASK
ncbi:response regulator [Halalkalibacter akibai]|uniref:Response regulatory domain-containing protein n=1 Tax=Halalkalibacter akibai (strain ATCC 43226 / DSM 21942 / CIP 109018 / JCM 9157 / 1139) TaxID=1236973 RepID=W4QXG2_HALA3|nr:response regulator [Halalkalibacter akibai]GAE35999.1 hypothetical protein JCM9157_3143 [Halalkalibacter akibai JCM 9157]